MRPSPTWSYTRRHRLLLKRKTDLGIDILYGALGRRRRGSNGNDARSTRTEDTLS